MYIEDILLSLTRYQFPHDSWHQNFVSSVAQHIHAGRTLSTNQSRTIVKLVRRLRHQLVADGVASAADLDQLLAEPEHRRTPYTSTQKPREARYLGDGLFALRCKVDGLLVAHIKALGIPETYINRLLIARSRRPRFDWLQKLWIIPVHRYNLVALRHLLHEHRFHVDTIASNYLALCAESVDRASQITFGPDEDHDILIVNVCDDDILAGWMTENATGIVL
jgi:hypothetical protein